jgi:hypothetical protein
VGTNRSGQFVQDDAKLMGVQLGISVRTSEQRKDRFFGGLIEREYSSITAPDYFQDCVHGASIDQNFSGRSKLAPRNIPEPRNSSQLDCFQWRWIAFVGVSEPGVCALKIVPPARQPPI